MSEYEYTVEDLRRAPPVVLGRFATWQEAAAHGRAMGIPFDDALVTRVEAETVPLRERVRVLEDKAAKHKDELDILREEADEAENERSLAEDKSDRLEERAEKLSAVVEKIAGIAEEVRLGHLAAMDAITDIADVAAEVL